MKFIYENTFQEAKQNALSQLETIWKRISFFSIFVSLVLVVFIVFFSQNVLLLSVFGVLVLICILASINSYQTRRKLIFEIRKMSLEHSITLNENNLIIIEENANKLSLEYSNIHSVYKEKVNSILKQKGKFFELFKENTTEIEALILFGDFKINKLKINKLFSIKSLTNFIIIIPERIKEFEEELLNKTQIKSIKKLL